VLWIIIYPQRTTNAPLATAIGLSLLLFSMLYCHTSAKKLHTYFPFTFCYTSRYSIGHAHTIEAPRPVSLSFKLLLLSYTLDHGSGHKAQHNELHIISLIVSVGQLLGLCLPRRTARNTERENMHGQVTRVVACLLYRFFVVQSMAHCALLDMLPSRFQPTFHPYLPRCIPI
jgi:hypothetical protein